MGQCNRRAITHQFCNQHALACSVRKGDSAKACGTSLAHTSRRQGERHAMNGVGGNTGKKPATSGTTAGSGYLAHLAQGLHRPSREPARDNLWNQRPDCTYLNCQPPTLPGLANARTMSGVGS